MTKIIILAAGKGTRMKSDLPKVLFPINNRPMIEYLFDSVISSGIDSRPILVVSPNNKDLIKKSLQEHSFDIAIQKKQLGTGHAVFTAKKLINKKIKNIIVLYGDHPFISKESIKELLKIHQTQVSMMMVKLDNFNNWRKIFYHWGRVIEKNNIIKEIIEFKDASEEIKKVKKVNPALFCFNRNWLFENIQNLNNNNNQGEYYLTDLIKIAFKQNINIKSSLISAKEAMGINSLEELDIAKKYNFK